MAPRFLILSASPLQVRTSLNRLRLCPEPWRLLCQLLWPFPWYFNLPALLSVDTLQQHGKETIHSRQAGLRQLFEIPLYRVRDTPLRSLYRLYDDLCANNLIMMGYECEYFFYQHGHRWRLSQIPDPKDSDPVRYALLASMVEALVGAFNWRMEHGLRRDKSIDESEMRTTSFEREEAPSWASAVGRLAETLNLNKPQNGIKANSHEAFLKRNIEAPMGYLYTV